MQYSLLKPQLDVKLEQLPPENATRLHRALSWLHCAEQQRSNVDMQFISLWISFKACYSLADDTAGPDASLHERELFQNFIAKLVEHDSMQKIHNCLWIEFSGSIKKLIRNPFVFHPFWQAQRQIQKGEHDVLDWQKLFDQSSIDALNYMSRQKIPQLLAIVLDRLYELRNQIIDGGATFRSSINREQVEDGANLLMTLMPIVIEIMLMNSEEDWGQIYYPVVASE